MHLAIIGLNHKTAPVELREKLSIAENALPDALSGLKAHRSISECLILSTCNRTEVCAYTGSPSDDAEIIGWIGKFCHVSPDDFASHLYLHSGRGAVEHIFRVAAGIDSMMLGEAQILGQVKHAYATARRQGSVGPVLNALFQQAIAVGKRARTETDIGRGTFSVGSAAVQLARSIFDKLNGRAVLVVGAGKMSKLAIAHLVSSGASAVLVANRTYQKAVRLASQFDGQAVRFEELASVLETADIVITSTGAEEPIITHEMISSAMRARRGRPIFLIDMAVPRDIRPEVGSLDNVFLYNIDDLQAVVEADVAGRRTEIAKVEEIIAEEVEEFLRRFRTLDAVPIIAAVRERFESIRRAEFEKLKGKLPGVSPKELEAIDSAMRSIVKKICHQPIAQIKEYATDEDSSKLEIAREVFGICPAEEEKSRETSEDQG